MYDPNEAENKINIRLNVAVKSALKANINHMEEMIKDAEGILYSLPHAITSDYLRHFLKEVDYIKKIGYISAFEKNVELSKFFASKGKIKPMFKAMNLANEYFSFVNEHSSIIEKSHLSDFQGLEKKAYDVASNNMIDNALDFFSKNNFSGMNRALLLADVYSKKANNDLTGDIALLKNASKNYSLIQESKIFNYSMQSGPLDVIHNN
jgi:hypothetical protein